MARKKLNSEDISQSNRLILIYKSLLEGRKFTIKEMIEFVNNEISETSDRTVYRDIKALMEIDDRIVKKRYGRDSLFYIPHGDLTLYNKNILISTIRSLFIY